MKPPFICPVLFCQLGLLVSSCCYNQLSQFVSFSSLHNGLQCHSSVILVLYLICQVWICKCGQMTFEIHQKTVHQLSCCSDVIIPVTGRKGLVIHHKNTRVGLTKLSYLSCNSRQLYYRVEVYGKLLEAMPNVSNCKLLKK